MMKKNGYPLYIQVKDYVQEKIESGEWNEGMLIPKEDMLCRELKVSKITIREAMKLLVNDGKVVRIPGKGTFVSKPKLEQKLNKFFGFSKWALQNGLNPASRLLKVETLESNSHIAKHLGITAGAPVTRIERLRLGNDEPLMFEEIWISESLCPSLHLKDIANIPLNEIITNDYKIPLLRAVESIEPKTAEDYIARLLRMPATALLLSVEYTAYTTDSRIVYFVISSYRGDRVTFSVEITST